MARITYQPASAVQRVDLADGDASGAITTGGVAQQALAQNVGRRSLSIQNLDATRPLFVDFGATAVQGQPSFRIQPFGAQTWLGPAVPIDAISVIGPETGQQFVVKEG